MYVNCKIIQNKLFIIIRRQNHSLFRFYLRNCICENACLYKRSQSKITRVCIKYVIIFHFMRISFIYVKSVSFNSHSTKNRRKLKFSKLQVQDRRYLTKI